MWGRMPDLTQGDFKYTTSGFGDGESYGYKPLNFSVNSTNSNLFRRSHFKIRLYRPHKSFIKSYKYFRISFTCFIPDRS